MSVNEQVKEWARKGVDQVTDERAEDWTGKAIGSAIKAAEEHLEGETHDLAVSGLSRLGEVAGPMSRLGLEKLRQVAAGLLSDPESVEQVWRSAEGTSFEARRRLLRQASLHGLDEARQREQDWREFLDVLKDIGSAALKVALPILLAVVRK